MIWNNLFFCGIVAFFTAIGAVVFWVKRMEAEQDVYLE